MIYAYSDDSMSDGISAISTMFKEGVGNVDGDGGMVAENMEIWYDVAPEWKFNPEEIGWDWKLNCRFKKCTLANGNPCCYYECESGGAYFTWKG